LYPDPVLLVNAGTFVYCARMTTLKIYETFTSLQGESTYSGLPCYFIRLAGCNLRCSYCDTSGAWDGGGDTGVDTLVNDARASGCGLIEVTGGEPLIQDGIVELLKRLSAIEGRRILVETNGSRDISVIPAGVITIMDVKCPSSGQSEWFDEGNIGRLRSFDEVKFVLSGRSDYAWAYEFIRRHDLTSRCHAVLLSAVHGELSSDKLAEWILEGGLDVRLQFQLHKLIGHK